MSTFVNLLVEDLTARAIPRSSSSANVDELTASAENETQKQTLRSVLISLNPPTSPKDVHDAFDSLPDAFSGSLVASDKEEESLKQAVLARVMVGVYAEALNTFLAEATQAESEAEWWDNVERSHSNLAWYLLQTLPERILELSRTILRALHEQKIPVQISAFSPASLRRLFPSTNDIFRPNALTIALFPHLRKQQHILSLSSSVSSRRLSTSGQSSSVLSQWSSTLFSIITLPIELTRQECLTKRKELEKLRDERAEVLGMLSEMRSSFATLIAEQPESSFKTEAYSPLIDVLQQNLGHNSFSGPPITALQNVAFQILPAHRRTTNAFLAGNRLLRPSRVTLVWPKLLLFPPIFLYGCKLAYASRGSLYEMAGDAWSTLHGFWTGWLLEPLKEVIKTVRTGSDDGVIVQKEALAADLASLERMVKSLATDKLNFTSDQLVTLSAQIKSGDLTSVLELYEQDIKSPFKSAMTGTLLRSLFIQVQKAKVDIDQALSGIDKLLKSQELTFAFVGVAPALAVVYITAGYFRGLWSGGKGRGLYGGKTRRTRAWVYMRRIERLLIAQPHHSHASQASSSSITPLTSGLLLLSVTRLRSFAEQNLPPASHIREGFLEDIKDLEDPDLGRAEKLRVIERMWRCWGTSLKWGTEGRE